MEKRVNITKTQPETIKALVNLDSTLHLQPTHRELIKIRSSQINGCAYCINIHTKEARKNGETEQRIYLLNAWRETDFYTEEERSILALTEEMTLISHGGVSDETYQQAARLFDESYLANIFMTIISINAWNRIGISTKQKPILDHHKE